MKIIRPITRVARVARVALSPCRFVALFALFALFFGCSPETQKPAETEPANQLVLTLNKEQLKNISLQYDTIRTMMMYEPLRVNGMLDVPPQNQMSITARYGGVVKSISILPGTHVNKGSVLATLESSEFVNMQEEYLTVSAQLVFAEKELKRQQDLMRDSASARRKLEEATSNADVLRVRKASIAQKLALIGIKASLLQPESITSTVQLRAPFSGYVTQVYVNNGISLEPNAKVLELVDPTHLHAELTVFEKDARLVREDQVLTLHITGEQANRKGHIHLVGTKINDDRTVYVHAHLNEPDATLIPGTTLTAVIEVGGSQVNAVPTIAIVRHDGVSWIFTSEANNRFKMHEVKTGMQSDEMTEITVGEDLRGKQIATMGASRLLGVLTNAEE